jgi:hypothetical protein
MSPDPDTQYGRTCWFQIDPGGATCRLRFRYGSFRGQAVGPFTGRLDVRLPLRDFLPTELLPNGNLPPPGIRSRGTLGRDGAVQNPVRGGSTVRLVLR